MRLRQSLRIDVILKEFRGLKEVAAIKGNNAKKHISCITDSSGILVSE